MAQDISHIPANYYYDAIRLVESYFPFPVNRYRRYFGVVVTHQAAALFSARRDEMIDVMTQTLFYLDARRPVVVHSPFSNLPRQRIFANDMPTLSIFDLLREDDDAFIQRTGWSYQPTVSVYALGPDVHVLEPFRRHPRGGGGPGAGLGGGQGVAST